MTTIKLDIGTIECPKWHSHNNYMLGLLQYNSVKRLLYFILDYNLMQNILSDRKSHFRSHRLSLVSSCHWVNNILKYIYLVSPTVVLVTTFSYCTLIRQLYDEARTLQKIFADDVQMILAEVQDWFSANIIRRKVETNSSQL